MFVILLIVLLLFGSKKLPGLARSLGKGIRYFREATSDVQEEIKKSTDYSHNPDTPPRSAMGSERERDRGDNSSGTDQETSTGPDKRT